MGCHFSYRFSPPILSRNAFKSLSVVSLISSSVKVLYPGCAPRKIPFSPSTSFSHFFPSTPMLPSSKSPLTRILLACCFAFSSSISSSNLRRLTSLSASIPASRALARVRLEDSRGGGGSFLFDLEGFADGGGATGMSFLASVDRSFISSVFACLFSSRLRSKALIGFPPFVSDMMYALIQEIQRRSTARVVDSIR